MSLFKKNDDTLDQAIAEVTGEPVDPAVVEQAAARVWERLSQGAPVHRLESQFVASTNPALVNQVVANAAGGNPFVGTAFRNRVAASYQDGAGWLFSADLASLMARTRRPPRAQRAKNTTSPKRSEFSTSTSSSSSGATWKTGPRPGPS